MLQHRSSKKAFIATLISIAVLSLIALLVPQVRASQSPIHRAWNQALALGTYDFDSTVDLTYRPLPSLANVGLSPSTERLAVDGHVNSHKQQVELTMQMPGNAGFIEMRMVDGKAEARDQQGNWHPLSQGIDGVQMSAAGNNSLALLNAASNIRNLGSDSRAGIEFTRYSFDLSGPALARQLVDAAQRGHASLSQISSISQMLDMSGTGELWIGSDGLPLRQILHINYVQPNSDLATEATLTTTFSNFYAAPMSSQLSAWAGALDLSLFFLNLLMLTMFLGVVAWLSRMPRNRGAYAILTGLTLMSMLCTPLLRQPATASAAEKSSSATSPAATAKVTAPSAPSSATQPAVTPHELHRAVPMSFLAQQANSASGVDTDKDGLLDEEEAKLGTDPAKADSDGDGLNDGIEVHEIGTLPTNPDTDGDWLSDGIEVRGFTSADGRTWYLDPFLADSNRDGLNDVTECIKAANSTTCADTDGDGTPDVFDSDNDNDNIPDSIDAAPDAAISGAMLAGVRQPLADQKMPLKISGFTADKPLSVDLSLRPANSRHIWYSGNVLDWPEDDDSGQLQRVYTTTLGLTGKGANGDMQLTPMLEIELPYQAGTFAGLPRNAAGRALADMPDLPTFSKDRDSYANQLNAWFDAWLDREQLSSNQISVRLKDNTRTLILYVPTDLIYDPASKSPIGFKARSIFQPVSATPISGTVRLAWNLSMQTDTCTKPLNGTSRDTWCSAEQNKKRKNWTTAVTPVHSYYDDFYVTAVTIRESRGIDVAVAAQNGSSNFQDQLWTLARNLDRTFVAGSSAITTAEIKRRFDSQSNGATSNDQRWGIPANALRVATFQYASLSSAVGLNLPHKVGGVEQEPKLVSFLKQVYPSAASGFSTNILMATEQRTRTLSSGAELDSTNNYVIDLSSAKEYTRVELKWAPFQYKDAGIWEAMPIKAYAEQLPALYSSILANSNTAAASTAEAVSGSARLNQSLYLAYYSGRSNIVRENGVAISEQSIIPSDASLAASAPASPAAALAQSAESMAVLLSDYQKQRILNLDISPTGVLETLGLWTLNRDRSPGMALFQNVGSLSTSSFDVATLASAVTTTVQEVDAEPTNIVGYTVKSLDSANAASTLAATAIDLRNAYKAYSNFKSLADLADKTNALKYLDDLENIEKSTSTAAIVLTVAIELISFGAKALTIWADDSLILGDKISKTVSAAVDAAANIALSIVMGSLAAMVPVGTIAVLIIAVVDLIIAAICNISDWAGAKWVESNWAEYFCAGIAGNISNFISKFVYADLPYYDMDQKGRMNPTDWGIHPVSPDNSSVTSFYIQGQKLLLASTIVSNLATKWETVFRARASIGKSTDENLKKVPTVRYEFTTEEQTGDQRIDKRLGLGLDLMNKPWPTATDKNFERSSSQRITTTLELDKPGINWRPADLFLAEGYAVPGIRCVTVVCWNYNIRNASYINIASEFKFDILPPTLDSFYQLSDRGNNGFALGWDSKFPVMKDADGDGLRSKAEDGNDPNDNNPDSDGDGLGDFYEIANAGKGFNANLADSDGDGLNDADEVRLGTNPAQADGDNDGLTDKEEMDGWEIVYAYDASNQPLRFRTSSDPFKPDTDGDGILDKQEKTYGFNPRVFNNNEVLTILSIVDERDGVQDGYVADATTIGYTATITNTLRDRYALGLFEIGMPNVATTTGLLPRDYLLNPRTSTSISGEIKLADLTTSQKTQLMNRAGAIIADLRGLAGGRSIWLHFDEPANSTSFIDSGVFGNNASCTASGCPTTTDAGYQGRAISFAAGSSSNLSVAHSSSLPTGPFTINMWLKQDSAGNNSWQDLLVKQNGANSQENYALRLNSATGQLQLSAHAANCIDQAFNVASTSNIRFNSWNLVSASYDGSQAQIYVNGLPAGSASYTGALCQNAAAIQIGRNLTQQLGIDEISVYPFAQTQAEIAAQFRQPVLTMNFNGGSEDSSQFRQKIDRAGAGDPRIVNSSRTNAGQAAQFSKQNWYNVQNNDSLDLSIGTGFTLAAWLKPAPLGQDNNEWVGVFGKENGNQSYPSLEAKFSSVSSNGTLRIRFGNGNAMCESAETGAWFEPGVWQHVIVSYDYTQQQFVFYRNGVEKDRLALPANCAGNPRPSDTKELSIGRININSYFSVVRLNINDEGDGWGTAEMKFEYQGNVIWQRENIDAGHMYDDFPDREVSIDGIVVPKDDGGGEPGRIPFNDDYNDSFKLIEIDDVWDDLQLEKFVKNTDITLGNGDYTATIDYNNDGNGTLRYRVWNSFYNGEIDDLRIYRAGLNASEAENLFLSDGRSSILSLRLEEPPTSTRFADSSGNQQLALCVRAECPTAGLSGRDGQAVRFNAGQVISIPERPLLDLANGLTVGAWVKLDNPANNQKIVSKFDTASSGYILGVENNQLYGELRTNGATYVVRGGSIPANSWVHLAITAKAGGNLIGYVNGVAVQQAQLLNSSRQRTNAIAFGRPTGGDVTLFGDGSYESSGDNMVWNMSTDNATFDPFGPGNDDNNEASSIRWNNGQPCITLYDDDDYIGEEAIVCESTPNLGFNDRAQSARIHTNTADTESNQGVYFNQYERQYVEVPSDAINNPSFSNLSITAKVDLYQTGGNYTILARGNNDGNDSNSNVSNGFRFLISDGRLKLQAASNKWETDPIVDANPHNVAVTLGDGFVRFYVDGQQKKEFGFTGSINDTIGRSILIGRGPSCGASNNCNFFDGFIRDVGLYTYPIDGAGIADIHSGNLESVGSTGRVFFLPFDEGNGTQNFSSYKSIPLDTNDAPLVIGRASWANENAVSGLVDEVTILANALPASDLKRLIDQAPIVNLNLDEALDSTSFANQSGLTDAALCSGSACPKAGARGRIRESIVFDGIDDGLSIANNPALTTQSYSFEAWVRPQAIKQVVQPIFGRANSDGSNRTQLLGIEPGSLKLTMEACGTSMLSERALNQDQWNHVVLTQGPNGMRLYLNGTLDKEASTSQCTDTGAMFLGAIPNTGSPYTGMLDETLLYGRVLNAADVAQHYQYQESWFDIAVRRDLTIDAENPTIQLDPPENSVISDEPVNLSILAQDLTSPILTVEYDTGNGWQSATRDGEVWVYTLTPPASGNATIKARATDSVGHSVEATRVLRVDRNAPILTLDPALSAGNIRPSFNDTSNLWTLALSGSATDDLSAPVSVSARIFDRYGNQVGATLELSNINGSWNGDYVFPYAPADRFTISVQAIDGVGKTTIVDNIVLALDAQAPIADVTMGKQTISDVSSPQVQMASFTAATVPTFQGTIADTALPATTNLALHFEEPAGSTQFNDGSPFQYVASCGAGCPTSVSGYAGLARSFDGVDDTITISSTLKATASQQPAFTLSFWADITGTGTQSLISGRSDSTETLLIQTSNGQLHSRLLFGSSWIDQNLGAIPPSGWHHIAFVVDGAMIRSFLDGTKVAEIAAPTTTTLGFNRIWMGSQAASSEFFSGKLDELMVYDKGLGDDQIARIAAPVRSGVSAIDLRMVPLSAFDTPDSIMWQPTQISAPGQVYMTWSLPVPMQIEGHYRLDLRTTDTNGEQHVLPNVWTGLIDTKAPEVSMYYRPLPGGKAQVSCYVSDYSLDFSSIRCPVAASAWSVQSHNEPWFTQAFASPSPVTMTTAQTIIPVTDQPLRACDTVGHCVSVAGSLSAPHLPGISAVLTPTQLLYTTLDPIQLGGYVRANAGLQNLKVTAGSSTLLNQALSSANTEHSWKITFTPPNEGIYPIQAELTAADNATYTDPLAPVLVVDISPPQVVFSDTLPLYKNGTAHFSYAVSDTVGVHSVQTRINDGPWVYLPRPSSSRFVTATLDVADYGSFDGEEVSLAVRVTDLVGHATIASQKVRVDNVAPQTTVQRLDTSLSHPVHLAGTLKDGSQLQSLKLIVNGPNGKKTYTIPVTHTAGNTTNWEFTLPELLGPSGSYSMELEAIDSYGNKSTNSIFNGEIRYLIVLPVVSKP